MKRNVEENFPPTKNVCLVKKAVAKALLKIKKALKKIADGFCRCFKNIYILHYIMR